MVVLEEVDEFERDARNREECPRCRTTRMSKPNMDFLVSICGHAICDVCFNQVFHNTLSYPCVVCHVLRLRSDYGPKTFEDGAVQRNVSLRKDRLKDLNLSLEDFQGNIRKYNDYLEFVEDVVYNLEHDIDVAETRRVLTSFIERHKEAIAANKRRLEQERHKQLQLKREQARLERERQEARLTELRRAQESKAKLRQQILEQLATSDDPSSTLLKGKRALLERQAAQRSMFKDTQHTFKEESQEFSFEQAAPAAKAYPVFRYKTPWHNLHGPPVPSTPAFQRMQDIKPMVPADAAASGGLLPTTIVKRAIQDAFSCLFEL